MSVEIINLSQRGELAERASLWFHKNWGIPQSAYLDSMNESLECAAAVPQWFLALDGGDIVGGMGVIENDFNDRPDLAPNVCAVFVEPERRGEGIAGALLGFVCADMKMRGIDTLYLLTNHVGFYERYGWEYLCMAQCEGDDHLSRVYVHREKQEREE